VIILPRHYEAVVGRLENEMDLLLRRAWQIDGDAIVGVAIKLGTLMTVLRLAGVDLTVIESRWNDAYHRYRQDGGRVDYVSLADYQRWMP